MNAFEIIGKLYTLLGECDSGDLREAASIAGDTNLGKSLAELAKAKHSIEGKQRGRQEGHPVEINPVAVISKRPQRNGIEGRIERVVLDPVLFRNNSEVATFLTSLGLDIVFRGKDGRHAMLHRLMNGIYALDESSKKRVLAKVFSVLPKSETTGWFEAIRGEAE